MLFNYFKIAIRVITRQRRFTAINVIGLSIGLASFALIAVYLKHELSYDRAFTNADRIYRVAATLHLESGPSTRARTAPPFASIFKEEFPEIVSAVRIGQSYRPLSYGDKTFFDVRLFTADSTFFDLFDFPFASGDRATALTQPNTIVLTPEAARKYFGDEDPLGKQMTLSDTINLLVTGVLKSAPDHSHLDFDCIYSRTTVVKPHQESVDSWYSNNFYTYILLEPSASAAAIDAKFPAVLDKHMGADRKSTLWYEFFLQPVQDIHLYSSLSGEIEPNGSMNVIYAFGSIAVFILLIAAINFMNLSTAKAAKRANEVGIRKTAGASRRQLITQFLGESILLSVASALLALLAVQIALPSFSTLVGRELATGFIDDPQLVIGFCLITLIVGLLSGIYPAFFLSQFRPIDVLKGKMGMGNRGMNLRKGLVVFQFSISIILIAGTIIIRNQIHFMQDQDLGFQKEQLIVVSLRGSEGTQKYEAIKQQLLKHPGILDVSASAEPLGRGQSSVATLPEGWAENELTSVTTIMADEDFIPTHQIKLVAGRNFSKNNPADVEHAFIVNEAAVKLFGWKESATAIGKKLDWGLGKEGQVVGVVSDFHYFSLHRKVEPLIIHIQPDAYSYLTLRVSPERRDWQSAIHTLEKEWKALGMRGEFHYFFLDEDFGKQYQSEQRLNAFITYFSVLAIAIGCLGLFGLAAYSTEQRSKEIGIRKVLGASVFGLAGLLSIDFLIPVLIANVIAWPLAWYILNQWLSNFPFHIDVSVYVLITSGLIAIVIAWLTVGFESVKTALQNPVRSLRSE